MVTLINPAGPGIGDPVGMERMFTATCDQPRQREFTSTATETYGANRASGKRVPV